MVSGGGSEVFDAELDAQRQHPVEPGREAELDAEAAFGTGYLFIKRRRRESEAALKTHRRPLAERRHGKQAEQDQEDESSHEGGLFFTRCMFDRPFLQEPRRHQDTKGYGTRKR